MKVALELLHVTKKMSRGMDHSQVPLMDVVALQKWLSAKTVMENLCHRGKVQTNER